MWSRTDRERTVYTVYITVFLAGKSPKIRSYTVCIYGSGQPYTYLQLTYITVGSRSLRDHTSEKLIKFSILVREGVWGLIFEFESSSGRPCQELICDFERPPLLAAAVQADGQMPIGCMGRTTAECLHRCFPQSKKQPSYPLVIFTNSVWMPQGNRLKGL